MGRRALIALDTHALLWWFDAPERLSQTAGRALSDAATLGVNPLSLWELASLVSRGRITLDRPLERWVARSLADERVQLLRLGADAAIAAALLPHPRFPPDPADRLIYATAQAHGAALVTRDRRLRDFDPAGTLW